jgi:uncharacterized protein
MPQGGALSDCRMVHFSNAGSKVIHWECEQVFFNQPLIVLDDAKHSDKEERFAAFGQTDTGRKLTIVYTVRGTLLRVISARDMNKKERLFYEKFS